MRAFDFINILSFKIFARARCLMIFNFYWIVNIRNCMILDREIALTQLLLNLEILNKSNSAVGNVFCPQGATIKKIL